MIFTWNSDYVLEQRYQIDVCNGNGLCSLWGTDWILKYYLDELRLHRVNVRYQVSHPYKAIGRITILHIFTFIFLESRRHVGDRTYYNRPATLRVVLSAFLFYWVR
jgi:hypothetical protein